MKYVLIISIMISFSLILEVSSVVNFKEYPSEKKTISSNTYEDLLDIEVKCPFKGALKNFEIKKDSSQVWFNFNCYSSLTEANEYDESILKALYETRTQTIKYKTSTSLDSLSKIDIRCPVDFALNRFIITKDSSTSYLTVDFSCVGVKSSYQTPQNTIPSVTSEGPSTTLEGLSGLTCGDTTIETDEIPGTPLKGFQFIITSTSTGTMKFQYYYSYYKLRSIESDKKVWLSKTAELRNSNTQKN